LLRSSLEAVAMRDEEKMRRLNESHFIVDTSWKVLFGCATILLILMEGSGVYSLLFRPPDRIKTTKDMLYVLMPWIGALFALRSLRRVTSLKNLENSTFWIPRLWIAFVVCFAYILLIEGVGTLADWLR
jgi:hypothetical protein